jgi:transcriptional regulator with XRE-family HTH domain
MSAGSPPGRAYDSNQLRLRPAPSSRDLIRHPCASLRAQPQGEIAQGPRCEGLPLPGVDEGNIMQTTARMRDVAEAAGVARSTVHNALRNPRIVAPETLERVRKAIADLGYNDRGGLRKRTTLAEPKQLTIYPASPAINVPPEQRPTRPNATLNPELASDCCAECMDWRALRAGDRVNIVRNPYPTISARADDFLPDRSVVWLWLDGFRQSNDFPS